jgi:hypothetical protein
MSRRLVLTPFEETLQTKYGVSYDIVSVPPGWQNVVLSLFEKLQEQSFDFSKITQIKTKFGEFRLYYNCAPVSHVKTEHYTILIHDSKNPGFVSPELKKTWDETIDFYSDIIKNFCMRCGTDSEIVTKNTCQKCHEEEIAEMHKKAVQPEI